MKRFVYLIVFIAGLFSSNEAQSQVSIRVNIGSQPTWGPAGFEYARYYYLPSIDLYYDVMNNRYVYWDGYEWVSRGSIPVAYRNVDLYRQYKVVLNEESPWKYHARHHAKYASYAHNYKQLNIRDEQYHHTYVSKGSKNPTIENRVAVRNDQTRNSKRSTGSRNGDTGSRVVRQVR